ncbi:MAG: winged helix-turn-helix domain-containing protein [Candidatus Limnocylindrus sp.]
MRKRMQFSAERPRLERELDRLGAGGLGVIAGSAGYGKSSSVASWASRLGTPVRWIRGAERLSDALLLAAEEDGGIWLPRLGRAARKRSRIDTCAASLCADLAAPYASLTLIVDNTDVLTEDPESLALLRTVAERDPDGSRVIFIGRRQAALRLATARSKRAVLEVGAMALRVSPQQTRQIADARSWHGTPSQLEEVRRGAAGNGGILSAWLSLAEDRSSTRDLNDFIRRDVVGGCEPLLRRLSEDRSETINLHMLQSLWGEGLLIAPAEDDELGRQGWEIPALIASALSLPGEIAIGLPHHPRTQRTQRMQVHEMPHEHDRRVLVHDLGPLYLEIDGRTVDGSAIRPRSLALLMYLATRPRHSATRDEAIDALWPDADAQAGLNSLNQAIYHLRRAIDPDYDASPEGGATPYVRHEAEIVSMHPELVSFDSAVLTARLDRIRIRPRTEEIENLLDDYRGGFGAELPFEPWVQRYRGTIEVSVMTMVERAIQSAHAAGDYDRAINLAARATRIDPESGELLESLALMLAEDGALAGARRAARRAIALFEEMEIAAPRTLVQLSAGDELGCELRAHTNEPH